MVLTQPAMTGTKIRTMVQHCHTTWCRTVIWCGIPDRLACGSQKHQYQDIKMMTHLCQHHDNTQVHQSNSILFYTCETQCLTCVQDAAIGDEEEQVLALLLSKGAAESALADEMGRLKVQEEVNSS